MTAPFYGPVNWYDKPSGCPDDMHGPSHGDCDYGVTDCSIEADGSVEPSWCEHCHDCAVCETSRYQWQWHNDVRIAAGEFMDYAEGDTPVEDDAETTTRWVCESCITRGLA